LAKILEYACKNYKFESHNYNDTIRKESNIFIKNEINIGSELGKVNFSNKLNLWINGILFTMRNDREHGDEISLFKSSLTSLKIYAHNYFCFLSAYILLSSMVEPNEVTQVETFRALYL